MIVHPVLEMGCERVPLAIVDEAHDAVGALQDAARDAAFARNVGDLYPGIRAAGPDGYAAWLEAVVKRTGLAEPAEVLRASFAIATEALADLAPIQRIPHFDTTDPTVIAAVHYLCGPPHRGTAFYRHKRSGFERIDAARHPAWRQSLVRDARQFGLPEVCAGESTALFDRIGVAELRFNRVIFYPANCLHMRLVGGTDPDASPMCGRVTITSLLKTGHPDQEITIDPVPRVTQRIGRLVGGNAAR